MEVHPTAQQQGARESPEQQLEGSCALSSSQGGQSSGSEQAVGIFVMISEGGGRQCSC